ncbi:ATP-dependent RNA helicase Mak5p [Trichomonascus vanleenenianus]|uniref:ATP-dependent RNA helicase n=1 Tax=Trichomonascus vanleenenianus TaxID=2268995 RepID=UPI003EC96B3A
MAKGEFAKKVLKRKASFSSGSGPKKLKKKKETPAKAQEAVDVEDLKWKPVEVPDTLDDFEGFFGLEEIDGVGVEVVNGQVKFTKNKTNDEVQDQKEEVFEEEEEKGVDEDSQESKADKKPKSKKSKAKPAKINAQGLGDVDFTALEGEKEEINLPDTWKLDLPQPIRRALHEKKFKKPTEIQRLAIPEIRAGQDVIGKAATGSGKTLAYGIPILENHILTGEDKKWPSGLIFGPTRELVHQITNHLKEVSKHTSFGPNSIVAITGGLSIQKQTRLLSKDPAVVVATPGRFLELLQSSNELAEKLKNAETLVLDEADRLIQDGHFDEMEKILDILGRRRRQTLIFSATFQKELMSKLTNKRSNRKHADIMSILKEKIEFRQEPKFIDTNPAEAVARQVTEGFIECNALEKDLYLYYFILTYPARTMVFVNSIYAVRRIAPMLKELNVPAFALHSEMIQKQRLRSLERFRSEPKGVLIATDVAARGLDIPAVDHVVHYHVPRSADMYVHRSGRTARAGNEGVAVVLCSPDEAAPLFKLQKLVKTKIQPFDVDFDLVNALRRRIDLAQKICESEAISSGKKNDWLKEAADDLGADLDEFEEEFNQSNRLKAKEKKKLSKAEIKSLRGELKHDMEQPLIRNRSKYITSGITNMAQMIVSGKSHENVLGKVKESALEKLKKKPGKKNKKNI